MHKKKQKKEGCNLLKIAVVAACVSVALFAVGCIVGIVRLFSEGTWESEPIAYSKMKIHSYPYKTVYVAGESNRLDLTGGFVCVNHSRGKRTDADELPCTEGNCRGVLVIEITEGIENGYMEVVSDIDFECPGAYSVILRMENADTEALECSFPIQVISPDYVE